MDLGKNVPKGYDCNRMDWHERKSQVFLQYIKDQKIIENLNPAITMLYELPIKPENLLEYFAEYFEDGAVSVLKLSLLKAEICYKRNQLRDLKEQNGGDPLKIKPNVVPSSVDFLLPTPSSASIDPSASLQSIQASTQDFADWKQWKQVEEMLHIASVTSVASQKPLVAQYIEADDDPFGIDTLQVRKVLEPKEGQSIEKPQLSSDTIPGRLYSDGAKRPVKPSDRAKEYVRNVFAEEYKKEVLNTFPFEMLDDD